MYRPGRKIRYGRIHRQYLGLTVFNFDNAMTNFRIFLLEPQTRIPRWCFKKVREVQEEGIQGDVQITVDIDHASKNKLWDRYPSESGS
uniref:Uncharacterized protein n=1 Tax=Hyaloperonospora arabidopsidis (strain Emoy2) TaxID=559515 RepID=M4BFS7_HYAAE